VDKELEKAWADWLTEQHWDYFLTITFREPVPKHRAMNTLYFCQRTLLKFKPESLFLGAEAHLSTYMHIHGLYRQGPQPVGTWELLRNKDLPKPNQIFKQLFEVYGRTKVEVPRSQEHVAKYVTKYCVKALADFSFF